jgi:hypothetical protein
MGLTKEIELDSGILLPNAYIKITSVNDTRSMVDITTCIFQDHASSNDGLQPAVVLVHRCSSKYNQYFEISTLDEVDKNTISQSYEYIKSLKFFKYAEDVIE